MTRTICDPKRGEYLISEPKIFHENLIMVTNGDKNQYSSFAGSPLYSVNSGETFVGLGFRFRSTRMPGYIKHSLGLTLREGSQLHILFDICIYPNDFKSHMDRLKKEKIYGSHIHILNETHKLAKDYDIHSWQDYLNIFQQEANISFGSSVVVGPFAGDLL